MPKRQREDVRLIAQTETREPRDMKSLDDTVAVIHGTLGESTLRYARTNKGWAAEEAVDIAINLE